MLEMLFIILLVELTFGAADVFTPNKSKTERYVNGKPYCHHCCLRSIGNVTDRHEP